MKENVLAFIGMIILAAAPEKIDYLIEKHDESNDTYLGFTLCTDGRTTLSTPVHSDRKMPEYALDEDGNKLPCNRDSVFVANDSVAP